MLTNNDELKGLVIRARDGELGKVDELYFDDVTWAIRYLTADTGGWLGGRTVLISPISILQVDWPARCIDVDLTRSQIENSPNIDTHKPVSRQHEAAYLGYYNYPYYWEGPYFWGQSFYPMAPVAVDVTQTALEEKIRNESPDSHLRTTQAVAGYTIDAEDGEIGHVKRFIVDDKTWVIRYLEVATKNWWPGKKVLLTPAWVESVSWKESKVFVAATRQAIQTCPAYDETVPISRDYENSLYFHYGRPPYWIAEKEREGEVANAQKLVVSS